MKKSLLPFILFGLVIIAAGCKTAPEGKAPELVPTEKESMKEPITEPPATQPTDESETTKKQTTITDVPSQPQKTETKETEQKATVQAQAPAPTKTPTQAKQAAASTAKTGDPKQPAGNSSQKATAQKITPQKAAAQSGNTAKNVPQAKNTQTKPAKQEPVQQKTSKPTTAGQNTQQKSAAAAKKETPKTASSKQQTTGKTSPAKQPENKNTEVKPKEPAAYTASAQITDISWMIEQADASFVSKQHKGNGKMFVTMIAKYKGDLTAKDFQEAFFASPADVWILDAANAKGLIEINKKDKLLMLKHLAAGEGDGAAALGKWFVSITLAGQKPFEKELNVTGISGQTATVTADKTAKGKAKKKTIPLIVPVAKAENEQQALTFPIIHSVSRDADTIEIIFSINDSRVKNAYFYFDVPGEEYYRDSGSMIDATGKPVNGCRSFSTDGRKCQYVLRKDASNKDWFGKATQCFLVVSDVNRVASPWEERHRTISAASRITK